MSELSWRVYPRLYVVAVLWVLPIFLVLLMLTGFSWIILTCALLLAVLSLVLSASALRINVSDGVLQLRYWFYFVEVDIADITEVARVEKALVGLGYKRAGSTTSFLVGGPYLQATIASGTELVFSVREDFATDLEAALSSGPGATAA
ncbi:hypothetical protein [Brevibacterium gallinarum]|uniref:DUF304 domain-containing protein n=1 Tax=Brevibacterium gallinarum TaxID=2762220 RepID=A0ABR8WU21_9MICO|nr:hypothetical protein [Brevibacterium gallinarum]MBD8020422.1 hypothetical protein [Brevibacterium gallinarum]